MLKTPIAIKPEGDKKIIYYRCPSCLETLVSLWDDQKHKIKRPRACRDCGQELDWDKAEKTPLKVFEELNKGG